MGEIAKRQSSFSGEEVEVLLGGDRKER